MAKNQSNYQDLLKLLAIITMLIDHMGLFWFPEYSFMRVIGRTAMPIFCFFAGYNFSGRIRLRLLIYGTIMYFVLYHFVYQQWYTTNILISIFIGQVYLLLINKYMDNFWYGLGHVVFTGCLWNFTQGWVDYGSLVISVMILGQMVKIHGQDKMILTLPATLFSFLHSFFMFYIEGFFSTTEIIASFILSLVLWYALGWHVYERKVNMNISALSRHSLAIYVANVIIITLIWKYYVVS